MQKHLLQALCISLLLVSCKPNTSQPKEQTPIKETSETASPPATETVAPKDTLAEIKAFQLEGYDILGHRYGDLNKDDLKDDLVLILKKPNEKETSDVIDNPEPRPLLLLTRQADGSLKLAGRNDKVVLCVDCGGVFGDPYSGIAIKNGYFSIEHYGGSSWRWTKIITFKYASDKQDWYLHKEGGDYFHSGNPDEVETTIKTVKDFGELAFEEYSGGITD